MAEESPGLEGSISVQRKPRICPECGSSKLMRDYEAAEIVCMGCGCVIAEKLADSRPEWRAFDDEQKAKRTRVGAPVTFSVDYEEPILIRFKERVEVVRIGEFIDNCLRRGYRREDGVDYGTANEFEAFCFDKSYRLGFRPVGGVSRHRVSEDLYQLTMEGDRKVTVTGEHSLFEVSQDNQIKPVKVDSLKAGDSILAPRISFVEAGSWGKGLDDLEAAGRFETKACNGFSERESNGGEVKLDSFPACLHELMGTVDNAKASPGEGNGPPSKILLSEDMCKLLGFFVRRNLEKPYSNRKVRNRFVEELQLLLRNVCGVEWAVCEHNSAVRVEMPSKSLGRLLANLVSLKARKDGRRAKQAYDLPDNLKMAFLEGFVRSNGLSSPVISEFVSSASPVGASGFESSVVAVEEADVDEVFDRLRIVAIRRVKPSRPFAYDISVPGCENFLGGRGWVFLHNTIHDKGLSTVIDWRDKRSMGKELSPSQRMDLYKLRKWQRRVRVSDATERNLAVALSELSKLAASLNLPKNILETASVIYRRAIKKRLIRGRSIHNVTAAAIYISCRQCGVPRTLDEIAAASSLNKKDIGRSYRFMVRELETFVPPSTSRHYAAQFSNKLVVSGKAEAIAIKILETAKNMKLTSGRGPTGIAAAATYIATVLTNENKTQREIAEIANVTEVTIRNRYKELLEKLFIEVSL